MRNCAGNRTLTILADSNRSQSTKNTIAYMLKNKKNGLKFVFQSSAVRHPDALEILQTY